MVEGSGFLAPCSFEAAQRPDDPSWHRGDDDRYGRGGGYAGKETSSEHRTKFQFVLHACPSQDYDDYGRVSIPAVLRLHGLRQEIGLLRVVTVEETQSSRLGASRGRLAAVSRPSRGSPRDRDRRRLATGSGTKTKRAWAWTADGRNDDPPADDDRGFCCSALFALSLSLSRSPCERETLEGAHMTGRGPPPRPVLPSERGRGRGGCCWGLFLP